MYDRHVAAVLNEDDSTNEEFLWKEISDGKQYVYPRLLFIITGNNVFVGMVSRRRLNMNSLASSLGF